MPLLCAGHDMGSISSCDASCSEYWDNTKNKKNVKHTNIKKNEKPLHNVLESCTIIPVKVKNEIKNIMNEILHILLFPSSL